MFCAALHKGISKAEKDKYRRQHLAAREAKVAPRRAARRAKRKK
jgi:hypothetical protein